MERSRDHHVTFVVTVSVVACEHVNKRVTRKNELLIDFHKNVELHEEVWEIQI